MAQRCNRRNPQLRVLFLTLKKCSCIEQISMSSSFGILAKIPGGATFPRPPGPLECGNPECGASAPPRVCCLDLGPSWEYPGFLCPVWWGGCLLPRSLPSSFSLWDVTKSKPQSSGAGSSGNIRQTQRAETVQLHNTLSRGHRPVQWPQTRCILEAGQRAAEVATVGPLGGQAPITSLSRLDFVFLCLPLGSDKLRKTH